MTTPAIPATYDFNTRFAPLPVHNQGQKPICADEQWANHLRAFGLMYDHTTYSINPDTLTYTEQVDETTGAISQVFKAKLPNRGEKTFTCGFAAHYFGDAEPTPDVLRRAIWLNGVIQVSVPSRAKAYENAWDDKTLPVLKPRSSDHAQLDHSNLVVGYTADGILVLNSWGAQWGHQGRAILSWNFITHYGLAFEVDTYGAHPVDGLAA